MRARRGVVDRPLTQDALDDLRALDSGELSIEALELVGESLVLDAELVEHGGVQVVDRRDVLHGRVA